MKHKKILTILLILNLLFIWGNSLLPGETSDRMSNTVMDVLNRAAEIVGLGEDFFTLLLDLDGDGVMERSSHIVRKLAHVTEFACLGTILWLFLRGRENRGVKAFALGVLTAAMDETLQIVSHRGNQLRDVAIDSFGVALGLCFAALLSSQNNKTNDEDRG